MWQLSNTPRRASLTPSSPPTSPSPRGRGRRIGKGKALQPSLPTPDTPPASVPAAVLPPAAGPSRWISAGTYTDQQFGNVISCWFTFQPSGRIKFAKNIAGDEFDDDDAYSALGKNRADTIQWHPHLMVGWARFWDPNRGGGENGTIGHFSKGNKAKGRKLRLTYLKALHNNEDWEDPREPPDHREKRKKKIAQFKATPKKKGSLGGRKPKGNDNDGDGGSSRRPRDDGGQDGAVSREFGDATRPDRDDGGQGRAPPRQPGDTDRLHRKDDRYDDADEEENLSVIQANTLRRFIHNLEPKKYSLKGEGKKLSEEEKKARADVIRRGKECRDIAKKLKMRLKANKERRSLGPVSSVAASDVSGERDEGYTKSKGKAKVVEVEGDVKEEIENDIPPPSLLLKPRTELGKRKIIESDENEISQPSMKKTRSLEGGSFISISRSPTQTVSKPTLRSKGIKAGSEVISLSSERRLETEAENWARRPKSEGSRHSEAGGIRRAETPSYVEINDDGSWLDIPTPELLSRLGKTSRGSESGS